MTTTTNTTTPKDTVNATRWRIWHEEGLPINLDPRLRAIGTYSEAAITRVTSLAGELETLLERYEPTRAIDRFLAGSGEWNERLERWASLHVLERLSQLTGTGLKRPSWQPPSTTLRRRVLFDVEIGLVRHSSLDSVVRCASVGSLDMGLASGELNRFCERAILWDGSQLATAVSAPGTERASAFGYPVAAPRQLPVPNWARPSISQLATGAPSDSLLLYGGRSTDPDKIQSSILMVVRKALVRAGLGDDPTITPLSIRNTAGRHVYDAHGLEAAAAFLGHDDLMSVAREIGVREHRPTRMR